MNMNLKGFKANCHDNLMGDLIIHKGRCMTERETRILVNLGIEKGYETLKDVPDEMADEICDPEISYEKFNAYDDTPIFVSLPVLKKAIRRVAGYVSYLVDADELVNDVLIELGYENETTD